MRFKLSLKINGQNKNTLPVNYQYPFASWIYKTIARGNPEFSDWLHKKGYCDNGKTFKLFTFSNLYVRKREIFDDRLKILSNDASFIISFYPVEIPEHFITGLFRDQQMSIGDKISQAGFTVSGVEKLADPEFSETMSYKCISPVVVSMKEEGKKYATYISPAHPNYKELFIKNLSEKHRLFCQTTNQEVKTYQDFDFGFDFSGNLKQRLITIKSGTKEESKIRSYLFSFTLKAPVDLQKTGFFGGFGEKNSLGFGCGEIRENSKKE